MPRKRMIDPTIWEDEDFGRLSKEARLLFIGLFSNADDEGRIRANASYIRSTIFIYDDFPIKKVEELIQEVSMTMKSVSLYEVNGNKFIQLTSWEEYQKQQKDRIQDSKLPSLADAKQVLSNSVADAKQVLAQVKISKVKISKERGLALSHMNYLQNIPLEDLQEFIKTFKVNEEQVKRKGRELTDWCHANGKRKDDYKATLSNALRKDYGERTSLEIEQIGKPTLSDLIPNL